MILSLAAALLAAPIQADTVDVLIRDGTVYDGTSAPVVTDVALTGDRITLVGDAPDGLVARRTIDATGLVVTPGFVDPHVHATGDLTADSRDRRLNLANLMQGVTTVIVGNDGGGSWEVGQLAAELEEPGIGTNVALLVGFGSVRQEVLGQDDRAPSDAELERMRELVGSAMEDGAVGLSTGLFYTPQNYATTDEVVALAEVAAEYGGVYDSHLRDESSYDLGLLAAVREAIEIGERAGMPVNISHIKALGVDVWGQSADVIDEIRAARERGVPVTADQYPYEASGTSLHASLLPSWARAGGGDSLQARLDDPETRARIEEEMRENMRRRNGPDAFLIIGGDVPDELVGMTLAEVAAERGQDPLETAVQLIRAGGARIGSFNMSEDDIRTFMAAEFVMTGSDGSSGHPRRYGTHARKIRRYVLADGVISLERMIEASSAQPASVFGLEGRGRLEEGAFADVLVFDPAEVRDHATFVEPTLLSSGMRFVFVNGVAAVDEGEPAGVLAGRVLLRDAR